MQTFLLTLKSSPVLPPNCSVEYVVQRTREFACLINASKTLSRIMSHVLAIDWLDRLLTIVAPLGLTTAAITAIYYVAFSYGLGVVALAIGKDSTVRVVTGLPNSPLITMVGLPLIPVGLVLLEISDVEGR